MGDYTLAIGDRNPYGFSAPSDAVAALHASDYADAHPELGPGSRVALVLSGPNGLLTHPGESLEAFRFRVAALHKAQATDDVRPGDPTPPDCNMA